MESGQHILAVELVVQAQRSRHSIAGVPHVDRPARGPLNPTRAHAPTGPQPGLVSHLLARLVARCDLIDNIRADFLEGWCATTGRHAVGWNECKVGAEYRLCCLIWSCNIEACLGTIGAPELVVV